VQRRCWRLAATCRRPCAPSALASAARRALGRRRRRRCRRPPTRQPGGSSVRGMRSTAVWRLGKLLLHMQRHIKLAACLALPARQLCLHAVLPCSGGAPARRRQGRAPRAQAGSGWRCRSCTLCRATCRRRARALTRSWAACSCRRCSRSSCLATRGRRCAAAALHAGALTLEPERPRPPPPRPCCCLSGVNEDRCVPWLRQTQRWVDDVARWRFRQIIPCHFSAPVKAGPREFRRVPPVPPLPRACRECARAVDPRHLVSTCALLAAGRPSTLPTVLLRRPARRGAARSRRRQAARHPGKGCSAGC